MGSCDVQLDFYLVQPLIWLIRRKGVEVLAKEGNAIKRFRNGSETDLKG